MSDLHQVNPFSFSQQMEEQLCHKGVGSQVLFLDYWYRLVWCHEHSTSNTNEDSGLGLTSAIEPAV